MELEKEGKDLMSSGPDNEKLLVAELSCFCAQAQGMVLLSQQDADGSGDSDAPTRLCRYCRGQGSKECRCTHLGSCP